MSEYTHHKNTLLALKEELETELRSIATYHEATNDWQLSPDTSLGDVADSNEQADAVEDTEERTALLNDLETRYRNVTRALEKIADGTYGSCEISGEPIEPERLAANPAARTCITHRNDEDQLPL